MVGCGGVVVGDRLKLLLVDEDGEASVATCPLFFPPRLQVLGIAA